LDQFTKNFQSLKEKLFRKARNKPDNEPIQSSTKSQTTPQLSDSTSHVHERKNPYFIQIGLDFGTSYSKCVCRDMMTNKAWVHINPKHQDQELPFLIPSALIIKNNIIFHVEDTKTHYPENGLYHLKSALVLAANGHLDNPLLDPYRNAVRLKNSNQFPVFLQTCAIYFLAGVLGEIRKQVREHFPGFGALPDDYMAINLAIPVEDAQQPVISTLYHRILCESWQLSDQLSGHPHIHLKELISLRKNIRVNKKPALDEACFIYPEVSANVQGFVRSRVSSPGIYLFSDTGGGAVDQSIFIFSRWDNKEHLTYLTGRVLPFGSSQIERYAAEKCGKTDCFSLENWRERKERGEDYTELKEAQDWIFKKLNRGTEGTLALAKNKLFRKEQLNDIRVIFGGGGHCEYPYKIAVMNPFSGHLFRGDIYPDVIGMPVPRDLELESHKTKWMRRLNVAYGLSFEKSELAPFTYPKDLSDPTPEEIWQPRKPTGNAPSKDEC
jgi:hypothetical protein